MSCYNNNLLHKAVRASLEELPADLLEALHVSVHALMVSLPRTFTVYEPMLLLPAHAFSAPVWKTFLDGIGGARRNAFFGQIALRCKVTHIALNSPISLTLTDKDDPHGEDNVQRRPNISPLYGSFGPLDTIATPDVEHFAAAFWVSTSQNGIHQCWAPVYTMFSRGNIVEKARLLTLPSVKSAISEPSNCTAVDLFAGIGYFAFSYAKSGCARVLGFELNPWSVEAFRRGAATNKWSCEVVCSSSNSTDDLKYSLESRLTIFRMGNEHAVEVVESQRSKLPPVRHINLGLLPTSSGAYETALRCLDPCLGGWLHVHENFAITELAEKKTLVKTSLQQIARLIGRPGWNVEVEHVAKVKTYAPGVMHYVLDIVVVP